MLRCVLCLGGYLHVCHVVDPNGEEVELAERTRGVGDVVQWVARALVVVLDLAELRGEEWGAIVV